MVNTHAHYYWGKPTASIDWCEPNYIVSPYIAEFWNSISSLWLCVLAIFGLYVSKLDSLDRRVPIAYLGLCIVGIGSTAFHATLLYEHQLLDELPMIYSSLFFNYCVLKELVPKRTLLISGLVLYGVLTTTAMLSFQDFPILHQLAYAVLVLIIVGRSAVITHYSKDKKPYQHLYIYAFVSFGFGYLSWLLERKLCHNGQVIAGVQMHAIWHILTGLGTYVWIQFMIIYTVQVKNTTKNPRYCEIHRLFRLIPYVRVKEGKKSN